MSGKVFSITDIQGFTYNFHTYNNDDEHLVVDFPDEVTKSIRHESRDSENIKTVKFDSGPTLHVNEYSQLDGYKFYIHEMYMDNGLLHLIVSDYSWDEVNE
jgi:hypothetical protein